MERNAVRSWCSAFGSIAARGAGFMERSGFRSTSEGGCAPRARGAAAALAPRPTFAQAGPYALASSALSYTCCQYTFWYSSSPACSSRSLVAQQVPHSFSWAARVIAFTRSARV